MLPFEQHLVHCVIVPSAQDMIVNWIWNELWEGNASSNDVFCYTWPWNEHSSTVLSLYCLRKPSVHKTLAEQHRKPLGSARFYCDLDNILTVILSGVFLFVFVLFCCRLPLNIFQLRTPKNACPDANTGNETFIRC